MHQIRLYLLCTVFMVLCLSKLSAQTVIGGDTIDQSAILDIQDTAKGILLTRLTTTQRNAIPKPAFGLLILNTTRQCLEANIGSPNTPDWRCLTTGIPKLSEVDTAYWNRKLNAGDTLSLSARINARLSVADTNAMLSTYINAVDTAEMLSTYIRKQDTLSLSNRIDAKLGLPPTGNNLGNMLYWNGTDWVRVAAGQNGQMLQLQDGVPTWSGASFANLTTNAVSSITPTSATVSGQITADGGANVSARGIVWGTTANPTLSSNVLTLGNGTESFSGNLSGLSPNTIYYIRAYATNSAGTAYGVQQTFTTLPVSIPTLTTNGVSSITQTNAITGGNITNDGGATVTQRGVVYATTQNPTLSNAFTQDGSGTGNYTSTLSGLMPNTTYYVRAYATNSAGTAYGNQQTFVTQIPAVPSLSTREVINVTNATATSGGTISNDGGSAITAKGVVWATTANPTLSNNKTSDGTGTGTYASFLTGLSAGVTYYVRAYATNSTGTGYGNQLSFTTSLTSNTLPVVTSISVTGLTTIQATLNAEVSSQGGGTVTERGAVWNTTGNPTVNSNRVPAGSGTGAYSATITGLSSNQNYYVRAYAINNFGISYGLEIPFTTLSGLATLTTNNVVAQSTTANSGGNIIDNGGSSITARGVVWNTTGNPTISDNKTIDGSGMGFYASTLTGLTPSTTYYLRAYATNNSGTAYGNQLNFTPNTSYVTDIDGNIYNTVQIGSQVWMVENLKTSRYRNGDPIAYILGDIEWRDMQSGAWSYHNHDIANDIVYGKLYNLYAATDPRGLCPTGWHVPSDAEWSILVKLLDPLADVSIPGTTSSTAGGKMKATGTGYWLYPNTGATNESGFTALPGGLRWQFGSFSYPSNVKAAFWGINGIGYSAILSELDNWTSGIMRTSYGPLHTIGASIRCLKD